MKQYIIELSHLLTVVRSELKISANNDLLMDMITDELKELKKENYKEFINNLSKIIDGEYENAFYSTMGKVRKAIKLTNESIYKEIKSISNNKCGLLDKKLKKAFNKIDALPIEKRLKVSFNNFRNKQNGNIFTDKEISICEELIDKFGDKEIIKIKDNLNLFQALKEFENTRLAPYKVLHNYLEDIYNNKIKDFMNKNKFKSLKNSLKQSNQDIKQIDNIDNRVLNIIKGK